jgi:isocitrate dehydrogenase (NAD+)
MSRGVMAPKERVTATLIPGDGVGPEMVTAVEEVFKAAGVPMDFEVFFFSEIHSSLSVPVSTVIESISRNGMCLKGVLQTPMCAMGGDEDTLNMKMRKGLDVYANVVKVTSIPGVKCKHNNVDLVIIREQTEGEYSCLEHESVPGVVECLKVVTATKSYRIAKFAFDYATKHGRKKVTVVHKANIMKLGDGLFLRCCEEVSRLYPDIEFERMIVDNACMQMVSKPQQFDVLVMPNLYGNIISNVATGLVGGAGLVAGEGYSTECVVFEPGARHSFGEAVGKNVANPTAMLFCAANLLDHASLNFYGKIIRESVYRVLKAGKVKTQDLGGYATTKQFTNAVIQNLNIK